MTPDERRRGGLLPASWHVPSSTEYYATVSSPARYYERLGEAGIDFAVLYPTMGIAMLQVLDDEVRTTLCRLYNEFMADQYRTYGDRFTVAALIPMNSPEEAIDALEQANLLGSKVGLIASHVHRGVPGRRGPPTTTGPPSGSRNGKSTGGSTHSASTALTTTTRCGPKQWS